MSVVFILCLTTFLFLFYYFLFAVQRAKIYGSNLQQLMFSKKLKTLNCAYYPSPLYFSGVLQTIFGFLLRPKEQLHYARQIFTLEDGGQVALDFLEPDSGIKLSDTLVIIIPGMTSSSRTSYVRTLALSCISTGANVVVMNNRVLGGVPLMTPRFFCATKVEDIKQVLESLSEQFPFHQKVAVGALMGTITLGLYLFSYGREARANLNCAVLISTLWDMHALTASLAKPVNNYFFNLNIGGSLKAIISGNQKMMEKVLTGIDERLENVRSETLTSKKKKVRTLWDFCHFFIVHLFNYKDVNELYDDMRFTTHIQEFTIPVCALNAADDPLQPGAALTFSEAGNPNSKFALIVTSSRGHFGFLEGILPIGRSAQYMERFVQEFLTELKGNRAMLHINNTSKFQGIVNTHANKYTVV